MVSALKNADLFLPIVSTDETGAKLTYYGGDQAWYKTRVGVYSGCGAVAAADIFAYLARQKPGLAALFGDGSPEISVEHFLEHMNAVIKFVPPGKLPFVDVPYSGLTSIPRFIRYCEAYAASCGVKLIGQSHTNKEFDQDQAIGKIAEQLSNDNPIALLIMQNMKLKSVKHADVYGRSGESDLRFHWVVITSIDRQGDKTTVTVSSEGYKISFDFADLWECDRNSIFGWRGIVYFI